MVSKKKFKLVNVRNYNILPPPLKGLRLLTINLLAVESKLLKELLLIVVGAFNLAFPNNISCDIQMKQTA